MIKIKPKSGWGTEFYDEDGKEIKLKDNFKAIECRDITRKVLFIPYYERCQGYDLLNYKVLLDSTSEEVSMYVDRVSGDYCGVFYGKPLEYFVKDDWVEGVSK